MIKLIFESISQKCFLKAYGFNIYCRIKAFESHPLDSQSHNQKLEEIIIQNVSVVDYVHLVFIDNDVLSNKITFSTYLDMEEVIFKKIQWNKHVLAVVNLEANFHYRCYIINLMIYGIKYARMLLSSEEYISSFK